MSIPFTPRIGDVYKDRCVDTGMVTRYEVTNVCVQTLSGFRAEPFDSVCVVMHVCCKDGEWQEVLPIGGFAFTYWKKGDNDYVRISFPGGASKVCLRIHKRGSI